MDKMDKVKILAVIGVLVMVGSMIAPQVLVWGGSLGGGTQNEILVGMATINGTLRTYDPVLIAPSAYNESDFDFIRSDEGFQKMTQNAEGWIIETKTRDDVYPMALLLMERNINTTTVGNIVPPSEVDVKLANGSTITTINKVGVIRMLMKPIVEEDRELSIEFIATVQNGFLVDIGNANLLTNDINKKLNATVNRLDHVSYVYSVPWDQRNSVKDNVTDNEIIGYSQRNVVYFTRELFRDEVTDRKGLPYVTYIDQHSIGVKADFVDKETLKSDFPVDVGFEYPSSLLTIETNRTIELGYPLQQTMKSYYISLPAEIDGYELGKTEYLVDSNEEYEDGQVIEVYLEGTAIGSKVVSVSGVRPS